MKFGSRKGSGYPEQRQFLSYDLSLEERWDVAAVLEKIAFRITGKGYLPTWKSFFFHPLDKGIFFGFNTIRIDGGEFVVFFETMLPRVPHERRLLRARQIKSLKGDNCKVIIAISQCAKDLQEKLNLEHKGIHVLHPPQKILVAPSWDRKFDESHKLRFFLRERDFARKRGIEILRALDGLNSTNWQLTVVSDLRLDDYATTNTSEEQLLLREEIEDILLRHQSQIDLFRNLPNNEVLELMQSSHVGLLPTWPDTYGYSVLEMQANGLPVITTDVRALPEINHTGCGWVLPVCEEFGAKSSPLKDEQNRKAFSKRLEHLLSETIESILAIPREDLRLRAVEAVGRIEREHDPATHKARLLSIIGQK